MIKSKKIILDASALIILIAKEKGWEKVASLLPKAIMSSVNVSEVAKYLIENRGLGVSKVQNLIEMLIEETISFDSEQAYTSAEIVVETKQYGLSLGDRACISLAITTGYPVYTADKAWKNVTSKGVRVELLR